MLFDPQLRFLFRLGASLLPGFCEHSGTLADPEHVENEGNFAVTHNGGSGIHGDPLQLLAQGLDHDFLGVVNAVYHQTELPVFRLQNDHTDRLSPFRRRQPQHLIEIGYGQQAPAPAVDGRSMHMLDTPF